MNANQGDFVAAAPVSRLRGTAGNWTGDALCLFALTVLVAISWLPRSSGPIDLRWDAGVYYVLGTSLAQGKGYRLLNEPGEIRAIQYPPGLPAIIAVEQLALRTSRPETVGIWLRRSWFVLSLLYIVLAFLLGRLFLSRRYAFLLAATCLLNYEMYFISTLAFAELPFAVTSTAFGFFYFERNQGALTRWVTALSAVASYLLRTIGIALLAAWIADAAFRQQYRKAIIRAAIALIPVILWQSYVHSVESSSSYKHPHYAYQRDPSMFSNVSYATNISLKSPFQPELGRASMGDLIHRVFGNLPIVPGNLGQGITSVDLLWDGHLRALNRLLKPVTLPSWTVGLCLGVLGWLVLAGIIVQVWRGPRFIGLYLLFSVGAICVTPWAAQIPRYIAPLEPFLFLALFAGLQMIKQAYRRIPSMRSQRILTGLTVSLLFFIPFESAVSLASGIRNFRGKAVYEDASGKRREFWLQHYPNTFVSAVGALNWITNHANRKAIVAISMPQWAYLKTGLLTVMPPLEANPLQQQRLIDSVPVTYLVLDRMVMGGEFNEKFPAMVQAFPHKWSLVYSSRSGDTQVYKRADLPF